MAARTQAPRLTSNQVHNAVEGRILEDLLHLLAGVVNSSIHTQILEVLLVAAGRRGCHEALEVVLCDLSHACHVIR